MAIQTSEVIALVPAEHRWANPFFAALMQLGAHPWRLSIGDGALRLWLEGAEGPERPVEMRISPPRNGLRCWQSTERFAASYSGNTADAVAINRLAIAWKAFLRFEPHIPSELNSFAFVGSTAGAPEEVLPLMFPFVTVERASHAGAELFEVLVRTTSWCNQACPFCSGPEHGTPDHAMLSRCISEVARMLPGAMLSLTGGEPAFRKEFRSEVMQALQCPEISHVQIQSNAVAFASRVDPLWFPTGGKLSFFLSMHALEEPIYDVCTGTHGQMPLALQGIMRVVEAGHRTVINTVINSANIDHLNTMASELPLLFQGKPKPEWHFSALICTERSQRSAEFLVPYRDMLEKAREAGAAAQAAGLEIHSMLQSTYAAVPPCVVPEEERLKGRTVLSNLAHETGYEDFSRRFVKAHRCKRCIADPGCLGVPRPYAERFGLEELRPFGG